MHSVMVVEDEALVLLDITTTLEDLGYAIHSENTDMAEAFEALEADTPDVALLDINVGSDNIWPLAHRLRELDCPIVFISADLSHPQLEEDFAGCAKLEKPVLSSQIHDVVRSVLSAT